MTDTKFKFGDHVIVKYDFYRGMAGKVTARFEKVEKKFWFKKNLTKIKYKIKTDTGNLEIEVYEDQIEIVGNK